MKHIVFLGLLISSVICFTSCASKSQKTEEKQNVEVDSNKPLQAGKFEYKPSVSHSYLTEQNVGEIISVKGKLASTGDNFTITENAASRNCVTFILKVEDDDVKEQLRKHVNQTITVSGELTDASSTWTKKMKVLSVE